MPPKNHKFQVRLTSDQLERLKQNAQMRGFLYLSSYIRFMALDYDFSVSKKIEEMYRHLIGEESPKRRSKKNRPHPEALWSK